MTFSRLMAAAAVVCVCVAASAPASAHTIVVDGDAPATEWFDNRTTPYDNGGIIARDGLPVGTPPRIHGEYVWRDATADTRTDVATPESIADITRVQITGNALGFYVLVRLATPSLMADPAQVRLAIDTDRVTGSGNDDMLGFSETLVSADAEWEFLAVTHTRLLGMRPSEVLNATGMRVATFTAARGMDGIEMFIPWSAIGLTGPPAQPLRFTLAVFREAVSGDSVEVGGSDALDVVSDYGDPRATMHPNTFTEVMDGRVDYYFDVHFSTDVARAPLGEVYAPLLVSRFLAVSSVASSSGEFIELRNVSPNTISLTNFKITDEETVDGTEGSGIFPATHAIVTGGRYVVAQQGLRYRAIYGESANSEVLASDPAIPELPPWMQYAPSMAGAANLSNTGDEILLFDQSNTVLDVVAFGTGMYPGIVTRMMVPAGEEILTRNASQTDTDDTQADFSSGGITCVVDGGPCADGGAPDAALDAGADAAVDAAVDAGEDAALDVAMDAGVDAAVDAALDVGVDAAVDVAVDVAVDTGADAGEDVAADVVADAGADAGEDVAADVVADAGADAGEDVVTDMGAEAGEDVVVADAGEDATATDAGEDTGAMADATGMDTGTGSDARADAAPTGNVSIGGGGACACRAAGAPASDGQNSAAILAGLAVAGLALARRRRRSGAARDAA